MSVSIASWDEKYTNHAAWAAIEESIQLLDGMEVDDPDLVEQMNHVRTTLQIILEWRDTPSLLVSQAMLDSLQSNVNTSIKNAITQWQRHRQPAYITNIYSNLGIVLETTRGWPQTKDRYAKGLIATIQEVGREAGTALESLKDNVDTIQAEMRHQLVSMTSDIDTREAAANETLATLTGQVTQAEQTLTQLLSKATDIDTRVDAVLTTQQNTFTTAESARQKANSDNLDKQKVAFGDALDEAVKAGETKLKNQTRTAQDILDRIRDLETQARNATVSTAGARTSKDFKTYAEEQRKQADRLRTLAIILFVAAFLAGSAGWIVAEVRQDSSWSNAAVKTTLTFTLVAAAGYAIKESSNHRQKEEDAKSAQLRLEALEPFISNLGPKDVRVLRMAAAQDLFIVKDHQYLDLEGLEEDDDGAVV